MHNLFLSLVQFHFRDLIVIDKPANQELYRFNMPPTKPINPKDLEKARGLLNSGALASSLNHINVPILKKLLEECGKLGALDPSKKNPMKKDTIQILLVTPTPASDPHPMEVDEITNEAPMEDDGLLGNDIVEDCKVLNEKQQKKKTSNEPLMNGEINEIQAHLRAIKRPAWNRGPPTNLGDAEHGKLKAEQWRSVVEFDLPVILYRMWGAGNSSAEESEMSS
ncbi:hypothetical protein HYDPIDRAFT_33065 [Hydnomerulius pinastri MD-312]|uniref:Uncharacterized protein n=1 Tax=Hydnomerulius pinastri MD-312 TaxID=994086 RepID=A0A0C9W9I2_9AGAM|nr:hypothetical protein HYDPIDRAFT_33065 [Hydnomerulius pinastri MD-312]